MKRMIIAAAVLALLCVMQADAQFRKAEEVSPAQSFVHPPTSEAWLGFFNPENFTMRQSYSMSYSAFGRQGIALGRYTNSMMYKFSDKLDARVDVSLQHSPYSTLDKRLQSNLTGIFIDRAELNYKPADNMFLRVSFRQVPYSYYGYGYESPYSMGYPGFFDEGY
ncbi:MAG: hypothetical protein ACM3Q4_16220 [Acidobacteriota bacterium]